MCFRDAPFHMGWEVMSKAPSSSSPFSTELKEMKGSRKERKEDIHDDKTKNIRAQSRHQPKKNDLVRVAITGGIWFERGMREESQNSPRCRTHKTKNTHIARDDQENKCNFKQTTQAKSIPAAKKS